MGFDFWVVEWWCLDLSNVVRIRMGGGGGGCLIELMIDFCRLKHCQRCRGRSFSFIWPIYHGYPMQMCYAFRLSMSWQFCLHAIRPGLTFLLQYDLISEQCTHKRLEHNEKHVNYHFIYGFELPTGSSIHAKRNLLNILCMAQHWDSILAANICINVLSTHEIAWPFRLQLRCILI